MGKPFKIFLNLTYITSVNEIKDLKLKDVLYFLNLNKIKYVVSINTYENELDIKLYGDTFTKVLSALTHIYLEGN